MSFESDEERSSRRRIDGKIRTLDFGSRTDGKLITWKGAVIGFAIGAVALVVILCFRTLDFRSYVDGTLLAIPFVTAIFFPLLYSSTRRIMTGRSSSRRRSHCPDPSSPDADPADADSPRVPDERTDEDFIPRDGSDSIEELRRDIRQRLADGATQREVEDELIARGLDPTYATVMVSSVRTTGRHAMPSEPAAEFRFDDPGNRNK